jgi:hypothetical protein
LIYYSETRRSTATQDQFRIGVDDTIIVPLVLIVFLAKTLYEAVYFVTSSACAFVFALFLWLMISPLLVAATAGDAMAWLIKRVADLPLPGAKCEAWRDLVD